MSSVANGFENEEKAGLSADASWQVRKRAVWKRGEHTLLSTIMKFFSPFSSTLPMPARSNPVVESCKHQQHRIHIRIEQQRRDASQLPISALGPIGKARRKKRDGKNGRTSSAISAISVLSEADMVVVQVEDCR
jgi:hypothetical protein